ALNPVTNRLYVAGELADRIVVVDAGTFERIGIIRLPAGLTAWRLACNPATNRLYGVNTDESVLFTVDCSRDSVTNIRVSEDNLYLPLCTPSGHRVYCYGEGDAVGALLILDGATDSLLARLDVATPTEDAEESPCLVYDPVTDRLFCPGDDDYSGEFRIDAIDGRGDSLVDSVLLAGCFFLRMALDSARGRLLCVAENDSGFEVVAIDAATCSVVGRVPLDDWDFGYFVDACHNPADNRFYLLDDVGAVVIVNPDSGGPEDYIDLPSEGALQFKLHPDNRHLFCLDEYAVSVADCETREVTADVRGGVLARMLVHPSTGLAYCADYGNERVRVVDTAGQVVRDIWTASDIGAALFDDARGLVYLADRSQDNVLVFDAATAEQLAAVPVGGRPDVFCVNPRAPRLYCARYNDKIAVVDLDSMTLDTVLSVDDDPDNLCYDPTTDKLYVACEGDDVIHVIDGATYETVAVLPAAESPRAMCVDTIAGRLFCCLAQTDEILVIDTRADTIITRLTVGDRPSTLCFDPARRRVYCANYSGNSVTIVDAVELRVVGTVGGLGRSLAVAVLDPALGRLYCKTSASIDVIDCTGDSLVQRIPFGGIGSVALDRARTSLFVIESDPRRVVALDAATGEEVRSWDTLYYPYSIASGESFDQLYVVSSASRLFVLDKPVLANALSSPTGPTHLRSELTLLGTKAATVHDITGRRVADFSPGRNDLSRLPAGIYFIRREGERETAKVVITR
ncbi:MAG: hypothetical protein R6X13_10650, partial [bacterium]